MSSGACRLLWAHVSRQFFDEVVVPADRLHLRSDAHFTVDGTLIEAAGSLKRFRPEDEPPDKGSGAVAQIIRQSLTCERCATFSRELLELQHVSVHTGR
jgi:hypothetical protein